MAETLTAVANGDGDDYQKVGIGEAETFANSGGLGVLNVGPRYNFYAGRADILSGRRSAVIPPLGYISTRFVMPPFGR